MLIGLTGKKQSGKDTIAAYLMKNYSFERRAFADPLKLSLAKFLNISVQDLERMKNDPTAYVAIGWHNQPTAVEDSEGNTWQPGIDFPEEIMPSRMWSPASQHTVREALQRYGTESHRDVFGPDFWLDATLPVGGYYAGRKIVVTDVRFDNEAARVRDVGGCVVRVLRPYADDTDVHTSEQPISRTYMDYTIRNDGTIESLYKTVDDLLTKIGLRYDASHSTKT